MIVGGRKEIIEVSTVSDQNQLPVNNKKIIAKKLNVSYTLRPVYYFSRAFGLFPFTLVFDSNYNIQNALVTHLDLCWFFISICFYIFSAFYAYKFIPAQENGKSQVLILGDYLLVTLGLILAAFMIMADMFNRFKLIDIIKKITTFDNEVMKKGVHFNYEKIHNGIMCWYIGNSILSLLAALSTFIMFKDVRENRSIFGVLMFYSSHIFQHFVSSSVLTTYTILMFALQKRFDVLSALLRNEFLNKNPTQSNIHKQKSINFIKSIGRMHSLLTKTMERLNECYSIQAMVNIGGSFIFSVLTFYTLYRYIVEQNEFYQRVSIIHIKWEIFYTIYAFSVILAGSLVAKKGKKCSEIAHKIINECYDAELDAALSQMSQQIQNQYPVATCGLFVFDWTLLYAMIGSIATYLTILVQFDALHAVQKKT